MKSRRTSLLLLLSCGPLKPYSLDADTGSSTAAVMDSSGPTTTGNIAPDGSTSSTSTTGATSTGDLPQICTEQNCPPGFECVLTEEHWDHVEGVCTPTCELLSDDCPEGQKCFVYGVAWEHNHCVPLDPNPAGLGEPCTWNGPWDNHADTCAADLVCWYPEWDEPDPAPGVGVCVPFCAWPHVSTCPEGTLCLFFGQTTDLGICTPQCDPTQPSCPPGSACAFHGWSEGFPEGGEFVCDGTEDAQGYGSPCSWPGGCTDGHLCVGADAVPECNSDACCTRYCDTGAAHTCPGSPLQECISLIELWGDNTDPPGQQFAHIGLCTVP